MGLFYKYVCCSLPARFGRMSRLNMAPTRVLGLVLGFLAPWSGAYVLPFHPSAYMVERGRELKHGGHGAAARLATREFVTDLPELMVDTRLAGWRVKKEREERQPVASDSPVLNDQHPAVIGDVVEYPIPERLRLERGENRCVRDPCSGQADAVSLMKGHGR